MLLKADIYNYTDKSYEEIVHLIDTEIENLKRLYERENRKEPIDPKKTIEGYQNERDKEIEDLETKCQQDLVKV